MFLRDIYFEVDNRFIY